MKSQQVFNHWLINKYKFYTLFALNLKVQLELAEPIFVRKIGRIICQFLCMSIPRVL